MVVTQWVNQYLHGSGKEWISKPIWSTQKSVLQIFMFSIATVMEEIMRIWVHFEDICSYHGNQVTRRIT